MEQTISTFSNPSGSVAPHKQLAGSLLMTADCGFAIGCMRHSPNQTVESGGQLNR